MIRLKETNNYDYAIKIDLKDRTTKESKEEVERVFKEDVWRLWEVYKDGERIGVVFSCCVKGTYTIDGYNETKDFWAAVVAGRKACDKIFEKTDVIYTLHDKKEWKITLLAKMMGFQVVKYHEGDVLLKREKAWGIKPLRHKKPPQKSK